MARAAESAALDWDPEEFRRGVEANLEAGSLRLVFAADHITDEFKHVVEYLNSHSDPSTEILALELGFVADEGVELLIPSVYGEEAVRAKALPRQRWDETSLFDALQAHTPKAAGVVRDLYDMARGVFDRGGGEFRWGNGPNPSVTAAFRIGARPVAVWNVVVWTDGAPTWAPQFIQMRGAVDRQVLVVFADRLSGIPDFCGADGLKAADFNRRPQLNVDALADRGVAETVKQALEELLVRATSVDQTAAHL